MRGRLQTAECRLLSNAVNSVEAGDFSTPLRYARNDMKGRSAAQVQMVQMVQKVQRVVVAASPQYLGSFL